MTPKRKRNRLTLSCGVVAALLCANAASASGYLPMPERRETLTSHKACVARLNTAAAQLRAQVKPRAFRGDGSFQQINLEDRSGGVKTTSREAARYEARLWYHNGRLLEGGTQYEINHSWNHTNLECKGKVLIMTNAQGYTLSTFEPVPTATP